MRVTSVEMRDFRTYARATARLGSGLTVLHGPNGAGKSNLLEAVYFGCTGRSPRTRSERELVRFGCRATRVTVNVEEDGREHQLTVGYSSPAPADPAVKRMTCDGALVERLLDVPVRPLISVFLPERPDRHIQQPLEDRKSTRLNSSHANISYAVFCLKKKKTKTQNQYLVGEEKKIAK